MIIIIRKGKEEKINKLEKREPQIEGEKTIIFI